MKMHLATLMMVMTLLVIGSRPVRAAELSMQLALPDVQLVLAPASPPQLQKEGQPLVSEQKLLGELLELIGNQQYEAGLALLREEHEQLLALVEAGTDDQALSQLVVPGGFMTNVRANQVSATLMYLLGHTYLSLERFNEAALAFRAALVQVPDYLRVHESLGLLYLNTEQYALALQHLSRAAALGLHTANLFAALGVINQQLNNNWGAIAAFEQALMLDPASTNWKHALLFSLSATNQYQSGLTLVEELLQEMPDDANLWLYRSSFALQAGQQSTALTSLETSIRLGEATIASLQIAASLHMDIGSVSRAVELLQQGYIAGLPFNYMEQALAWLIQNNEWELASQIAQALHENDAELNAVQRSSVLASDAQIALHNNQATVAKTTLQEALALDPGNAQALVSLGSVYMSERDYGQAELLYQRASVYPAFMETAQLALAQIAIDLNNYERALTLLQDIISRNPARIDLRRNIETLENLLQLNTGN